MLKKKTLLYLALLVFISLTYKVNSQNEIDTTLQPAPDSSFTEFTPVKDYPEISENDLILDMLDSLVAVKFYSNSTFTADTVALNRYDFAPGYIPEYPDSVLQKRIEDLNLMTPIELTFNKWVKNYIHVYANKRREVSSRVLGLAEIYFPLFEEMLDKYNMPLELKYLAVVESALNPTANSRAGAKGLWQFMYGTGKMYGLKVNSLVDDRFDPYKSTDAACRHLKDLYDIYGNWNLALAAYNSGAGNVNKAIRRAGGTKSYWAIWPFLPRETRGYVPAFIAAMYIMNYAAEHNIYPIDPGIYFQEIDTVIVNEVLSFDQLSEFMNIEMDQLKMLNPTFKEGIIPSNEDNKYVLRLPVAYISAYIEHEKELFEYKTSKGIEKDKLLAEIKKAQERNIHIVRSGENLGLIAQRYRCSVYNLRSWNNLRGNTIYPGQKLVVYAPGYSGTTSTTSKSNASADISNRDKDYHIVRNGENLGLIANKYKCSVSDLKAWNNLSGNLIQPNQKLIVYAPKAESTKVSANADTKSNKSYVYHTVRKGDTLWDIAKLYEGVSVDEIKKLNDIHNSKKLKPGQKIKVAVKS
ncbi:MAG: LysM peptidoglycan-binding domain-containing protein [Bacteroidales bacterium]|nr:LysM peptidoglycan-binding domain-containing protein [Bacteroidales bacterium]